MKSIYDKFLDFKKRNRLSNSLITKITKEYANSDLEFARSHFSEKYKISEYVFYKARDYAVIFCLVNNEICKKLRTKSATNYSRNNDKNSAVGSLAHFDYLLVERQDFLNGFSNKEILDIAHKYVEGTSVKDIAIAYDTGEFAIKKLLEKGIVELIFDSNIVGKISNIVGQGLDKTLQKRKENKKALLLCIKHEISFLTAQITCYHLYFRNCETKPDLESLNQKLKNAIKMYNETLRL